MLALIGNLSTGEIVVIAIVAILIFGRRLPEVAGQTFRQVTKLRRNLEDLRRESGIDRELRNVRGAMHDLSREIDAPASAPAQPALPGRREPRLVVPEPPAEQPRSQPPPESPPPPAEAPPADEGPRPGP